MVQARLLPAGCCLRSFFAVIAVDDTLEHQSAAYFPPDVLPAPSLFTRCSGIRRAAAASLDSAFMSHFIRVELTS